MPVIFFSFDFETQAAPSGQDAQAALSRTIAGGGDGEILKVAFSCHTATDEADDASFERSASRLHGLAMEEIIRWCYRRVFSSQVRGNSCRQDALL